MNVRTQRESPIERLAYTPKELAAALGLSRKAVYRAIASGELWAAKVCGGSRLLVPVEAAHDWIERNLVVPRGTSTHVRARVERHTSGQGPLGEALAVLFNEDDAVDVRASRNSVNAERENLDS